LKKDYTWRNRVVFISVIILAAGESIQMGRPKLLMGWNKETILEQTIDNYLNSLVNETVVVLGHQAGQTEKVIGDRPVITVINPHYTRGISTSIVTGLNFVSAQAKGIIIALADQPSVGSGTINKLIGAFNRQEKGIVIPAYQGKRGNPVIFAVKYRKELLALTGDNGAKEVVQRHPEDVAEVVVGEDVLRDIDTPEDYNAQKDRKNPDN